MKKIFLGFYACLVCAAFEGAKQSNDSSDLKLENTSSRLKITRQSAFIGFPAKKFAKTIDPITGLADRKEAIEKENL